MNLGLLEGGLAEAEPAAVAHETGRVEEALSIVGQVPMPRLAATAVLAVDPPLLRDLVAGRDLDNVLCDRVVGLFVFALSLALHDILGACGVIHLLR